MQVGMMVTIVLLLSLANAQTYTSAGQYEQWIPSKYNNSTEFPFWSNLVLGMGNDSLNNQPSINLSETVKETIKNVTQNLTVAEQEAMLGELGPLNLNPGAWNIVILLEPKGNSNTTFHIGFINFAGWDYVTNINRSVDQGVYGMKMGDQDCKFYIASQNGLVELNAVGYISLQEAKRLNITVY